MNDRADLVVVGSGPAGIEAAVSAAKAGVNVIIIDAYPQPGGQYYKQLPKSFTGEGGTRWHIEAKLVIDHLKGLKILVYSDTIVWGIFRKSGDYKWCLTLYGSNCPKQIYARSIILATGAYDRSIPFPGWTLAGVMTAGAVQTMIKNQRILPGKRFLLSGTGPLQLALAAQLVQAGAKVDRILEGTQNLVWRGIPFLFTVLEQPKKLWEGFGYLRTIAGAGIPIKFGWSVIEVRGEKEVEEAVIARLDINWKPIPGTEKTLAVDTVVIGYNLLPSNELSRLIECEHYYEPELGGYLPRRDIDMQTSIEGIYAAGDGAGIGGIEQSKLEGRIAGLSAAVYIRKMGEATAAKIKAGAIRKLNRERRFSKMLGKLFTPGEGLYTMARKDTIICRCENVTLEQIDQSVSWHIMTLTDLKNITRIAMGNCQGRVCSEVAARIFASRTNQSIEDIGALKVRPPIHPIPIGYLEYLDK